MQLLERLRPLALFLLRLSIGVIFVQQGYLKLFVSRAIFLKLFPSRGLPCLFRLHCRRPGIIGRHSADPRPAHAHRRAAFCCGDGHCACHSTYPARRLARCARHRPRFAAEHGVVRAGGLGCRAVVGGCTELRANLKIRRGDADRKSDSDWAKPPVAEMCSVDLDSAINPVLLCAPAIRGPVRSVLPVNVGGQLDICSQNLCVSMRAFVET
jgi:hypothetical protein